jgi:hypothetical protein
MKKILICIVLSIPLLTTAQIDYFDTSEEIVPLRKTSKTVGKCCRLGKVMGKVIGFDEYYLTQAELNLDGSYNIFFVSSFTIGFDNELTQLEGNPTDEIVSFNLADKTKFDRLRELIILGTKGFKANPIKQNMQYIDISEVLDGGSNEGDKLLLRFNNDKIIKFFAFQLFDKETGTKSSSISIFSKFINQLFGSEEEVEE